MNAPISDHDSFLRKCVSIRQWGNHFYWDCQLCAAIGRIEIRSNRSEREVFTRYLSHYREYHQ